MADAIRAFVGMGGNIGDVANTLMEAIWALEALPQTSVRSQSDLYRSPPWGRTDQAEFINAVVELQTRLAPSILLDRLIEIEERFGRVRNADERWGPRTLDLDLLLYGDQTIQVPGLCIPHPHLHERGFVLVPLAQIAPNLDVPGQGRVADLLADIDASAITLID
ncbi:MAG: 2-amino-4-hydroxy-6-hydroxymethyldihydropteridine diphosphokinase [Frankiaceae bacterium]|nr:2-amino-4-hydroxy-6-hydroxymethyldihydropteridine diphosphokinase [Arenimonas sp.]